MQLLRVLSATIILSVSTIVYSFSQEFEYKVDSVLQELFQPDEPGGVFLVAKDGKIMYRKAFGLSNIELSVPMKPENVFQIGSMTKQFTAVAVLMLAEEGKLHLEDDITEFMPDYPTHGKTVTIHHLLTHTSGIKDFTQVKALRGVARNDLKPIEIIELFQNEPFDFSPGEEFRYSNSGYILLGYIIEKLSGVSYERFVEDRIFRVAGMKDSRYAMIGR